MKQKFDIALLVLCSAFVLFCGAFVLLRPADSYSEEERRPLAQKPSITLGSIVSGDLLGELSDLFCDQFPARRAFTSIKAASELLMGKRENNDVVFAADGYLITSPKYDSLELYEKNLRAVSAFCTAREEYGAQTHVFFAPRAADVLREQLPQSYPHESLGKVWDIAHAELPALITVTEAIKESADNDAPVWFRTDHHWTHLGAYECYVALSESLGYAPYPIEHWAIERVSEDFLGTVYSKSGAYTATRDSVSVPMSNTALEVTYHSEKKKTSTLYDTEKLLGVDKYSVYLGGNFDRVSVRSLDGERPRLTLIKDSFANSVIPYLAEHFDLEIYDLRYFKGNINTELSKEDVVLILYGIDTALTDGSLGLLLR